MSNPDSDHENLGNEITEACLSGVVSYQDDGQNDKNQDVKELLKINENYRKIIGVYDNSLCKIEELLIYLSKGLESKYKELLQKNKRFEEEILNLDRAYKYTYGRLDELRTAFESQQKSQSELIKINNDLKKALELSATRINEMIKELSDIKEINEAETSKLNASLKLDAVKIASLESTITELTHQNNELTNLCEEFLS